MRYLLLVFFLWAIFGMSAAELSAFIGSPYNRVADIKMYMFFEKASVTTIVVLTFLAVASVLVNGVWCRYLCPYGALVGLVGRLSPARVERNKDFCIDCRSCDSVCMARLPVSNAHGVGSVECTGCLDCLASCPAPGSLSITCFRKPIGIATFTASVMLIFVAFYSAARITGHWRNDISSSEYIQRVAEIDSPAYAHPGVSGVETQPPESQ
jgi:polyferredoxin